MGTNYKATISSGTGLLYDERLTRHACPFKSIPFQSEHSDRLLYCYKQLSQNNLIDRCINVPARLATDKEILTLHSDVYLQSFKATQTMTEPELKKWAEQYDDIYANNYTYECASLSLGGLIDLTEKVVKGDIRNGIAITRPPGHHAMKEVACGYSFFNNVAIAAHLARKKWNCDRVLIVDWDVHHGQGVQYLVEDDPSILYFSIHRYEHREFWPHLLDSDSNVFGKGKGLGYNINVPWNKTGMGDSEYLAVFQQLLLPIAYEFNPDLVLVCCGFDAGLGDPKGRMCVTPEGYAHMTHALMGLADGKVVLAMEGGYHFRMQAASATMCTQTLLGDACPLLPSTSQPHPSAVESILDVIKHLRPYWQTFKFQGELDQSNKVHVSTTSPSEKCLSQPQSDQSTVSTREEPGDVESLIDELMSKLVLTVCKHRTCLVYDEDMTRHLTALGFKSKGSSVTSSTHPECPERITQIFSTHEKWNLVSRCLRIKSRRATKEEIQLYHTSDYIDILEATQDKTLTELYTLQENYTSVYLHQSTYDCALLATGSTLNVVDAVLSNEARNGVAIVRPPGHHAESHAGMGFCIFNTVAIAARYAKQKHRLSKILIVDWDIHHGNGSQHEFESDPNILYISLHRYDNGTFFPCSPDGAADMVGKGPGEGFNVNIAWNNNAMGNAEYIAAFTQIIMPIAYEFCPDLVLVSAGFDAAFGDPLGGYQVTPEAYGHMTHMLCSLANGKVIVVLEGGYNLNSISQSMAMCTRTLLGDPPPHICPGVPCGDGVQTILTTLNIHKQYWKSLKYQVDLPVTTKMSLSEDANGGEEAI